MAQVSIPYRKYALGKGADGYSQAVRDTCSGGRKQEVRGEENTYLASGLLNGMSPTNNSYAFNAKKLVTAGDASPAPQTSPLHMHA